MTDQDELYDDGLDDLSEAEEDDAEEEAETPERKQHRVQLAFGVGNLFSVIAGSVAVLVLLTLLLNMISFVLSDLSRNLSLFQNQL